MKYSIHGFYQPRAVELGLSNDDLLVLRWFVDFAGTKKMKTIIEEDGIYYWVNYTTVLEDLPVLRVSKQTLKRKHFDNLCNSNVLKHKHIKDGGSFSYFTYGINYDTLVYLQDDTPTSEFTNPTSKFTKGYVENYAPPTSEFTEGVGKNLPNKDYSINNSSINNYSIKENIKENKKEKYGKYSRVKLTSKEYLNLCNEFGKDFIDRQIILLDEYVESNNNKNKYTNFNLVLRKSIRDNWFKQKEERRTSNVFMDIMLDDYENN